MFQPDRRRKHEYMWLFSFLISCRNTLSFKSRDHKLPEPIIVAFDIVVHAHVHSSKTFLKADVDRLREINPIWFYNLM